MIQRLKSILTEQTLEVKVKCVVDQTVIDKNFQIIRDCLKDLQDKHSVLEKNMQELIEKNDRMEKDIESARTATQITGPLSEQIIKVQRQEPEFLTDQNGLRDLIKQLQDQMNKEAEKNKKNNLENIKDINILLKDVKQLKERVDGLQNFNKDNETKKDQANNNNTQSNLQNIRILQNQLHKQSEKIDKFQSQVDKLKNKNSNIMQKLKTFEGSTGLGSTVQTGFDDESNESNLLKQFEKLSEKVQTYETHTRQDMRKMGTRFQNVDLTLKELENRVTVTEEDIEEIKQKILSMGSGNNSSDPSADKEKLRLEKELKKLEESNKKDSNRNDEWRRRMDQTLKQHTLNIADIQNQLSEMEAILSSLQKDKEKDKFNNSMKDLDDSKRNDRLPSIAKKGLKLRNISREDSGIMTSQIDKKLQQLKGELQQWVRQLLDARGMTNQDSSKKKDELIDGIDIRLQQIKLILEKKADNDGVKKYLSFLDNKINQMWSIMSQPDTEDALIARKGWNCLSCAKKLEKYRGKIGEQVNWNGLTTTNYSPPRVGYSQSVSHNTTQQNITMPASKPRQTNQQDHSKQFA